MAIVKNENTYQCSSSSENILAASKGENDEELNGYDLFNKYIAYDLGKESLKGYAKKFSFNRSELSPNPRFFTYAKKPRRADALIALFATELHRRRFFSDAVNMYDLYIAQQPDPHSIDCIFARLFIEFAKNMCATDKEQRMSSFSLNVQSIKVDLLKLANEKEDASHYETLFDEIDKMVEEQKEFVETEKALKKVFDGVPEAVVDKLRALKSSEKKINKILDSIEQQFVREELMSNYSHSISDLNKKIAFYF